MTSVDSRFEEIRQRALQRWQELYDNKRPLILVGTATCGRAAGSLETLDAMKHELARQNLDVPVVEVGCVGHCYAEPLVAIYKPGYPPMLYAYVTQEIGERLVKDYVLGDDPSLEFSLGALEPNDMFPPITDLPRFAHEKQIILQDCGFIDPEDIDQYIAKDGYEALNAALKMKPEEIIEEVRKSGLRGRGGAGFPTWQKWQTCLNARGKTRYVVCNADEGDPGAFMDRAVLEGNPHSVIEGMLIAGYAVGARRGYIYVRAEYPLAAHRVDVAVRQARRLGLMGRNVLGSGFSFDVRLFQGSGAFVCGEETALIASLEGKPGLPHHRPPSQAK